MGKNTKRSDGRRQLSVAVLAGGRSSRMGTDKAFVDFGGRPLILHVVDRLRAISDDVFVVAKAPTTLADVRVVHDITDVRTPLAGIAASLEAVQHALVFVCGCDMPFVSTDLVELLFESIEDAEVAVPLRGGRAEPMHAVWNERSATAVAAALEEGEHAVHRVLDRLRVSWVDEREWLPVDPEARSFQNLNTPADLERARSAR